MNTIGAPCNLEDAPSIVFLSDDAEAQSSEVDG
jgi:hypothetical protein